MCLLFSSRKQPLKFWRPTLVRRSTKEIRALGTAKGLDDMRPEPGGVCVRWCLIYLRLSKAHRWVHRK